MSLKVWLPLIGDLRNNGLSTTTITNNGAIIDNDGKVGKCYKFVSSSSMESSYLELGHNFMTSFTKCSLCFWLKIVDWNTSYATFFQAGLGRQPWNNYIFGVLRNGDSSKLCFTVSDGTNSTKSSCLITKDLSIGVWYHFTCVYSEGHCKIYLNGELNRDYATTIVPAFSNISRITIGKCNNTSVYQSSCMMNDVRVYDHALSVKEIKEISKGLVCHYTFSSTQLTFSNILYDSSGNGYNGETYGGSVIADSARNLTSVSFTANSQRMRVLNLPNSCFSSSYTFSWWGNFTNCTKHMMWGYEDGNRFNLYMGGRNVYLNTGDNINNPFNVSAYDFADNNWHHFAITGDGISSRLYIDGEFKGKSLTYKSPTGTTLYFNGWDSGTSHKFNGRLSDFRLYSTTLSDEDIMTLYHTPISIAKTGETFIQGEYTEFGVSHIRFKSTGNIESDGVIQKLVGTDGFMEYNEITRIYKDCHMGSVEFKEY